MNKKQKIILIIGIIFISFNLRAPLTAIGSLASIIRDYFQISNSLTGFITTLPLIVFAIVSPFVTRISLKFGNGLTMLIGLLILISGELIRSYTGLTGVFIGTVILATGICIGNVLIPSIIKLVFPDRVAAITSIYTPVMSMFAAISSGISIPLATGMNLGWQNTLSIWLIVGIFALIIWIPQLKKSAWNIESKSNVKAEDVSLDEKTPPIWKSPLAWYVTLFMGLQSILFYCFIAWLPAILQSNGLSSELSGYMLSLYQITGVPASFVVSQIADKIKSQRILAAITSSIYLTGILGLAFGSNTSMMYVYLTLMGIGSGSSVSLALSFMGLRASNAKEAAKLSGMAQSIGYLLGAIGPLLIGSLYDVTGSFREPFIFIITITVLLILLSFGAGQDNHLFSKKNKAEVQP